MAKKRRSKAGKKAGARSGSGRRGRRAGLSRVPIEDLVGEIRRRASELEALHTERESLAARIAEIDEIVGPVAGGGVTHPAAPRQRSRGRGRPRGSVARAGGKRPRNEMTLEHTMHKVLKGKTMGVTELSKAVLASGYKTNAENFRTMVNQTLIRSDMFKKVQRGKYTTA